VNARGYWLRMLSAHARLEDAAADAAGLMVALETAAEYDEAEALGRDVLVALEQAVSRIVTATHDARKAHDARSQQRP
jgi:hypothetical protein